MSSIDIKNSKQLVQDVVHNLNSSGIHCLENVIDDNLQKKFSEGVKKLLESKGKRYFSLVDVMSEKDLPYQALSQNDEFTSFLISLSKVALNREISKSDSLNILRVVAGNKSETQSFLFHYDAYSLTALTPIIIPDGPLEKSGHLVIFPNLRKFRSIFLINLLEKLFFQNSFMRKILSKVIMSNLEKYAYLMKPGNVYLFWGYRSLHANLPVDPSYTRATLLYHFGDVHPKSVGNKVIKFTRHAIEKVNVDNN